MALLEKQDGHSLRARRTDRLNQELSKQDAVVPDWAARKVLFGNRFLDRLQDDGEVVTDRRHVLDVRVRIGPTHRK